MRSLAQRFWSKVDKTPGQGPKGTCWEWRACRVRKGYGRIIIDGKVRQAQQVAWELANNRALRPGYQALHKCDNPPCCNPMHLFEGTTQDNTRDMIAKNRNSKGASHAARLVRGENHHATVLIESDIYEIHRLLARGISHAKIADLIAIQTGRRVTRGTISNIAIGNTWGHVKSKETTTNAS